MRGSSPPVTVIVPCFNEAGRLRPEAFLALAGRGVRLLFVDDGSRDGTAEALGRLQLGDPARIEVLALERNEGKGEAVRHGLLRAIDGGAEVVGYLDADLATPGEELLRLAQELEARRATAVLGSRIQHLGSRIHRLAWRHALGRIFAWVAAWALGVGVYDTQCGAKLFRVTPRLREALLEPFASRWVFDLELLGRLLEPRAEDPEPAAGIIEIPLRQWDHVSGSKLRLRGLLRIGWELARVSVRLARRRRAAQRVAWAAAAAGRSGPGV